jgi:hypothetical protein
LIYVEHIYISDQCIIYIFDIINPIAWGYICLISMYVNSSGHHGRDGMAFGLTTTYAYVINDYNPETCEL